MSQLNHVFICGAHSTGKTTLLDRLREHRVPESLNFMFQEEIARKIVNQGDYSQVGCVVSVLNDGEAPFCEK